MSATRWGSAADAGRLCTTSDAPDGVDSRTYRVYVRRQGAPGPKRYSPTTGIQEYDLDAVVAWNAARPGAGRRSIADGAVPRRTDARLAVLSAAAGGRLVAEGATGPGEIRKDLLRISGRELDRGERYAVTELHKAGLLAVSRSRLRPTPAGRRLLAEWAPAPAGSATG